MTLDVLDYSADEMMTIAAARRLNSSMLCFVGIGLPSAAANLARATHAPGCVLIYESGTIGAKPRRLPLSIGDDELAETAEVVVSMPEIFNYWLQAGRIDIGFLGAAQIDRYANLNSTVIGPYEQPQVRLPGAGGAPEIASCCQEVIIVMRQTARAFVQQVDFISSVGFLTGGETRQKLGLHTKGPTTVITQLGILEPDPISKELTLTCLHPGVTLDEVQEATGWPLKIAPSVGTTEPPSAYELAALRDIQSRTRS